MTINDFTAKLRLEVQQFFCNGRRDSASFLIWYLQNFFRIEQQDAIDCVCDSINDKGIDGIYVDEEDEEIFLFQTKYSPEDNREQGDNDIRNFIGAKQWFNNEDTVNQLLSSTASQELKAIVNRLNLREKIRSEFEVYLQFVTK